VLPERESLVLEGNSWDGDERRWGEKLSWLERERRGG